MSSYLCTSRSKTQNLWSILKIFFYHDDKKQEQNTFMRNEALTITNIETIVMESVSD